MPKRTPALEREIAEFHGVRPVEVEVFEDDAALYRARRRERMQQVPRRAAAIPFKLWWADATPFQRFEKLWWWSFKGLGGFALGLIGFAVLFAAYIAFR